MFTKKQKEDGLTDKTAEKGKRKANQPTKNQRGKTEQNIDRQKAKIYRISVKGGIKKRTAEHSFLLFPNAFHPRIGKKPQRHKGAKGGIREKK